ncbi:MAG: efflux RND transporter permease subunit, partial [Planctomycetota bacterium]
MAPPTTTWRSAFARNPRLLILTLAMVLVAGMSSYQILPRREDPELSGRFANVVTVLPGASAERVETLVSDKLEEALEDIEEIKLLESDSRNGISTLIIELRDDVYDTGPVWTRVRDEISDAEAELPDEAGTPEVDELEVDAKALIAAVVWTGDGPAPHNVLTRLAEDLEDRLRALPGTKETEIDGASEEEVLVAVDASRLAALGFSIETLASRLDAGDSKVSAGRLHAEGAELGLEVAGEFDSLDRIRSVVLATGDAGEIVRLCDVATIEKTVSDPARSLAWIDGRPGVAVSAIIESSERIDNWAERARAELERFEGGLSGEIQLEVVFDQSDYTAARLSNLLANLGLGALLVVAALLVLMGWRSAILVGMALPLTSLMVLFGMRLLGVPIHQMSVTGLIIALGLLIDNAIVMVDEVRHSLDEGLAPFQAIERSVRRLLIPLFGSTFTTVLAFMPIVLMPGPAGEFVGAIGITVSLALVSSLFLSMTVLPAFTARLAKPVADEEHAPWWRRGLHTPGLASLFDSFLKVVLRHPILGVAVALILPASGILVGGQLEEQFFPPSDRDQFQVQLWLPQQATLEETSEAVAELRRVALEIPAVTAVHGYVGESAPKFYYNIPEGIENVAYYGQAMVELDRSHDTAPIVRELQRRLDADLSEA